MKPFFYTLLFLLTTLYSNAQTWTGNTSTDWNTNTNWSGNAVPLPAGNVTIPTAPAGNRWPVLASNVTVNGLTMATGSQLNVNGQTITVGTLDLFGTISNSNGATDISITLTGSGTTYIRSASFTDHVLYNIQGTGVFYDTYGVNTPNTYSGNVSYQRSGVGTTYIGYYSRSQYGGNVTITGTVPLNLSAFEAGANITGNLSCTHIGLGLTLGNTSYATNIGGTLMVMASGSGGVAINRLINQTPGGSITLQDRAATDFYRDTLKVNTITITGQTGALDFFYNAIVGNLSFTGAPTLTATSYVRSNVITGTASYTLNGTGVFYDNFGSGTANTYTGNVSYQRNGANTTYIGYYSRNQYGANVSITGSVPVNLSAFESGASIAGNLSCTHVGLGLTLGHVNNATNIGGTVNIMASGSGVIEMYRLINLTTGGSITLQDRSTTSFYRDTLNVNAITITGQTGALDFFYNSITGNLNFAGATTLNGTSYIRSSIISGNASYTLKGTGVFYDTFGSNTGNTYGGSVSYTRDSTGPLYVGYYDTVTIGANLNFNYSGAGAVDNRYFAFNGSSPSVINQDGNIPLQIYGLDLQKSGGTSVTLNDSLRIVDNVRFSTGNLITASQKELIFISGATTTGANDASKVVGPVVKIGSQAFTFPIGAPGHLQAVNMTAPAGATSRFRSQYVFVNPHPTYDTSMRAAGLAAISGCEYWHMLREIGTTNVSLTFDYGAPCLCVEVPANLRVAKWSGSQWTNLGNGGTTGDTQGGTVKPAAAVADYGVFTLGSSATVSPSVSIARDVANPVCICRRVTFTATAVTSGCSPFYQWKKNGVNVGTNSNTYSDSALVQGDVISLVLISSAAFAWPATASSNTFNITTTDINTWTGVTNTNWHLNTNWSCQSVPCTLSKVVVNGGAPNACEILSGNVKVINLTANNGSTVRVLNGSTLELKQP
jgi:hypothetical protein